VRFSGNLLSAASIRSDRGDGRQTTAPAPPVRRYDGPLPQASLDLRTDGSVPFEMR
jgi:hypothetical protein